MLKSRVRTLIQEQMDDATAQRWSAANLDLLTEMIYDEAWSEILDQSPWYNSVRQVILAASEITTPGFIDTSVSGGIMNNRFYRVQQLLRALRQYSPSSPFNHLIDQANDEHLIGHDNRYFFIGDQLWLVPLNDTTDDVDIRYSFLPAAYDGLADNVAIDWPDGHEKALIFRVAINAMAKGSAEDFKELSFLEQRAWGRLKSYLKRRFPGPLTISGGFNPLDWGGA